MKLDKGVKGVIFDMDGTILDSMKYYRRIAEIFQKKYGLKNKNETDDVFLKGTCRDAAIYIAQNCDVYLDAKWLEQEIYREIEHVYFFDAELKKGAYEFIKALNENEIKVAIATASEKYHVNAMCRRTGLDKYVDVIVTCTEAGAGKGKPDVYDAVLKRLELDKEHVVIFEDALYAIRTAKEANYHVIGVYDEIMCEDLENIRKEADCFIYGLEEVQL